MGRSATKRDGLHYWEFRSGGVSDPEVEWYCRWCKTKSTALKPDDDYRGPCPPPKGSLAPVGWPDEREWSDERSE